MSVPKVTQLVKGEASTRDQFSEITDETVDKSGFRHGKHTISISAS